MLTLKKVAVTGGIASGKTTVCRFFQELGAYVVNADEIVHQLLSSSAELGKEIIALLGSDIVVDDKLERARIAQKVFRDPALLKQLEKRVHPRVQKVVETRYRQASQKHYPLFVVEMPLLFEGGFENDYDAVIVVVADRKRCRERFAAERKCTEDEFDRRSQRLIPDETKQKLADVVVENNGSFDSLQQAVEVIFNSLKENL